MTVWQATRDITVNGVLTHAFGATVPQVKVTQYRYDLLGLVQAVPPEVAVPLPAVDIASQAELDVVAASAAAALAASEAAAISTYVAKVAATGIAATDTAALNAALAAGSAVRRRIVADGDFVINAPLVVKAKTTLDCRNATITLAAGSDCNMVQNEAVTTARSVFDASFTASSTTLTSATAAFVAGDVGKAVRLWGGSATKPWLDTTIAGYTNATTVTLTVAAGATKTNAAVSIGTRDKDITFLGGHWDRGANAGTGVDAHSIRLRRLDGVTFRDVVMSETAGKYMINPADVSRFRAHNTHADGVDSALIQGGGPMHDVIVDGVTGRCEDDAVAFTCNDWAAYSDTRGDITKVRVKNVDASTGQSLVKFISGVDRHMDDIVVDGVSGDASQYAVYLGDDVLDPLTVGGTYGDIDIRGLSADATTLVTVTGGTFKRIKVDGVRRPIANGRYVCRVVTTSTIGELAVKGVLLTGATASGNGVSVTNTSTVRHLVLDDWEIPDSPTAFILLRLNGSTSDHIEVGGRLVFGDTACRTVDLIGSSTVPLVTARRLTQTLGRNVLDASSTTAAVRLHLTDVLVTSASRIAGFANGQANVVALDSSVRLSTGSEPVHLSGGSVKIVAASLDIATGTAIAARAATEAISVFGQTLPIDVGNLARTAGSTCYNTNGSRSCGVGVVDCDGTTWKHRVTGLTF